MRLELPRIARATLVFNLFVIVWGAFVRASGSGAGCGSHWPLCNGEIIPHTGLIETAIEFFHRITSGVCLILSGWIAWLGMRGYPLKHPVRRASLAVLGFTLSEAIIGAGLVLFGYVNRDQSLGRVISISLHLTNTFLLLAALALTAEWSRYGAPSPEESPALKRSTRALTWGALLMVGLLGMSGAITALGDTLFRSTTLLGGMRQDFEAASHFLLKLRVIHPIFAVISAAGLFAFAEMATQSRPGFERLGRLSSMLKTFVGIQLAVGALNLIFLAPTALQLVHLLVAEGLWITLVLTASATLRGEPRKQTQ